MFRNLSKLLRNYEFGNENNVIIGGDFNCPLDITLDKKGSLPIPRKYVINSIDELQNEFDLYDIWRLKNGYVENAGPGYGVPGYGVWKTRGLVEKRRVRFFRNNMNFPQ